MKYTAEGFSQEKLVEYGLGITEAFLLRWIVDFYATGKMQTHEIEGDKYFWIYYKYVIEELPILGIKTTRSLARILMNLVDAGILKKHIIKLQIGTKVVYRFSDNYEYLITNTPPDKNVQCAHDKNVQSPPDKNVQSDSSIIDSSINIYIPILEKWNSKEGLQTHSEKIAFANLKKKHKDVIQLYGQDTVMKAVDNYVKILISDNYFFNYKWSLWDFIARGLDKFIDEADPFNNYKNNNLKQKKEKEKSYEEF